MNRIYNFSAGPAMLPAPVLEEAQRHLRALPGIGMSVLEISHRSRWFEELRDEAEANLRALLQLPNDYHVLFLQGGASLQFSMVPMNMLRGRRAVAEYILTGFWSERAAAEARREGNVRVLWSGESEQYRRAPRADEIRVDPQAAYVHFTSNETIQGVQFATEPETGDVPLICDASSDFLSRPIPIERYALLYAGAQKNAGTAGLTIVLLREDLLDRIPDGLPSMLDYRVHVRHRSVYNTPPVFAIYILVLVTRWLLREIGGLERMAALNRQKAQLLYDVIDHSEGFYRGHAHPESRSIMNVTWRLPNEELERTFLREAEARGLYELKGHRSVGGLRASLYNAMPLEGVRALCDFMQEFRERYDRRR
ncbi:MAG: 3-phosphoserine/phosphohydroxythreonine transaminase [Blastocatellia bacterium]|nr:3-phosphoserine/phosphohydroxythreonine transaminase [Blastocatellia bacterium]MCS7158420.1 3-phosphoserine/phosphohydroxythreonine transaminase [Blastocatellia bacterium]MCX7752926.1 3-phosphoserine/phosphohydroxythreonine transaminase [Blastocatellia bacterium]MDW8167982.1 3-phosphoserine/phosphohydroxythreonine transaminase [Acidobacteriota bacterium]MDW8256357.1 3-phosphoserine/phosphohydroxythreonine transaminase [Acidobacteriota bacterium]